MNNKSYLNSIEKPIIDISNEFYSMIPQSIPLRPRDQVGRENWQRKYCLNNPEILDDKFELLKLLGDVQGVIKGFSSDIGQKYKSMGANLEWVSPLTPEFKAIEDQVKNTRSSQHHWNLKVLNVWRIGVEAQKRENHRTTMDTIGNVQRLFHGSGNPNILGICSKGLLKRPPGVYITGSMFGNGLYFADRSSKSSQYPTSRFSGGNKYQSNFLFLVDVSLGKIKEYDVAQTYLTNPPAGFDSVMGKAGRSLVNNEYIIYDIRYQEIKYLIEFKQT